MSLLRAKALDFETTWSQALQPQVSRLVLDMAEGISHSDFMQLHTLIYKLCTIPSDVGGQAKAGELYFRLEQQLIAECKTMAAELLASGGILDLYVARWANFSKGIQALDGLFDYLNRYWIKAHGIGGEQHIAGVHASVRAMGVAVWRDYVQVAAVAQRVLVELWDMSMQARAGDEIGMDYGLARQVVGIYLELGTRDDGAPVYQTDFEDAYVAQTMHFYTLEAQELVSDPACDSTGYVSHAHARVSAELRCAARFTTRQTMSLLCAACEEAFISLQREWLQDAFDGIITDEPADAREQLWHIYSLLRRVDGGLDAARGRFHDLVVRQGSTALAAVALDAMGSHDQGAEDGCAEGGEARGQGNELQGLLALSFLEAFLHRYVHYHAMAHECFENDPEFVQAVDKGLVVVVSTVPRSAELLAVCAHSVLEEGGAAAMELGRNSEHALLHIITCLKYILDRETFQTHYARLLARRLINNTSLSLETEEFMAQALRRVTGADFASRLLRMLSDKARSVELDQAVASGGHGHTPRPVMQVMLLTAGTWPVGEAQRFELPATLSRALEAFTARYESEYKRRKLTWHLDLSRADVRAWFGGKMYDLSMSLKQLVVMLVFEDGGGRDMDCEYVSEGENAEHVQPVQSARAVSVLHLAQVTGLPLADVESVVRSLRRAGLLHLTVPSSPHVPEYSSTPVPPQCTREQDPEEGDRVQSDAEEEALAIAMSLEGCSGQRGMGEEGAGLTLAGLQVDDDYDDVRDVQAEAGQSSREEAFTLSLKEVAQGDTDRPEVAPVTDILSGVAGTVAAAVDEAIVRATEAPTWGAEVQGLEVEGLAVSDEAGAARAGQDHPAEGTSAKWFAGGGTSSHNTQVTSVGSLRTSNAWDLAQFASPEGKECGGCKGGGTLGDVEMAETLISLNVRFVQKRPKLKVPAADDIESRAGGFGKEITKKPEEKRAAEFMREDDLRARMQAIIVRIMKQRRRLSHEALLLEVREKMVTLTAYVPTNTDFKKILDVLLEKEYIERDTSAQGPAAYLYVA